MKFSLTESSLTYIDSLTNETMIDHSEHVQMTTQNVYMDMEGKIRALPFESPVEGMWYYEGQFFKPPVL